MLSVSIEVLWLSVSIEVLWLSVSNEVLCLSVSNEVLWLSVSIEILWLSVSIEILWLSVSIEVLLLSVSVLHISACSPHVRKKNDGTVSFTNESVPEFFRDVCNYCYIVKKRNVNDTDPLIYRRAIVYHFPPIMHLACLRSAEWAM